METTCEVGRAGLVDALLAAMTREEKYRFVRGTGWTEYSITSGLYIGNAGGQQQFGIPSLNMHDSGNGFNNLDITEKSFEEFQYPKETEQVTSFPTALNLASLWSEDYARKFGEAMGEEFKAKGANCLLGPAVEIHRVPRNGRNVEYISGESPYLGAKLVKPYIRGVQSKRVLASVKHFIANHQETCRRDANSIVDARTRYEMYYPPFEAAIEADVAMHMCGYNQVNGIWNCGSKEILEDDLRKALGFKGWVQSDWWAFHSFEQGIEGGVDQEMPGTPTEHFNTHYTDENLNTLDLTVVDKKVKPQLDFMLKYGLVEPSKSNCQMGQCKSHLQATSVTTEAHQKLSREIATKAVVLLKNDGLLPFGGSPNFTVAVLGSACDKKLPWINEWALAGASYYHIGGSGRVVPKGVVTVLDALKEMCSKGTGCTIVSDTSDDAAKAVAAAADADVAILCGGVASAEDMDRANLEVNEQDFIVAAAAALPASTGKVVVTMTAGTILMPWIESVNAALTVFNAGKYTGHAFVDILFGFANPSAKSPIFYPKTEVGTTEPVIPPNGQCPDRSSPLAVNYTEGLCVAWHCHDRNNILFPFGHGLSYTTFSYDDIKVTTRGTEAVAEQCPNQDADKGAAVWCVTVTVNNTGQHRGTEIAQLYLGYPAGLGEPARVLRGFHRLEDIEAGESMTAQFPIYRRDLQTYSAEQKGWQDHTGIYTFFVGASEGDIRQQAIVAKSSVAAVVVSV